MIFLSNKKLYFYFLLFSFNCLYFFNALFLNGFHCRMDNVFHLAIKSNGLISESPPPTPKAYIRYILMDLNRKFMIFHGEITIRLFLTEKGTCFFIFFKLKSGGEESDSLLHQQWLHWKNKGAP